MGLLDRLDTDLKAAMRARDRIRTETVRAIRGAVKNKQIELGHPLDEDEIVRVIRSLVKQREEATERYREAGRQDLADKESLEREILESYLPAAPDEAAIRAVVAEVVEALGASSPRDMGPVMKAVLARLGPAADGKLVSQVVRQRLAGG